MRHFHIFRFFFAIMLILVMITGAAAETAELKTTQQFIDYLEQKDIKYRYIGLDGKSEEITVSFNLDNFESLKCNIFFKDDLEEVSLRIWNILTATAGKNYILSTLNSLNYDYKFGKFVFDESDSTIQVEIDMYIDPDNCARSVYDSMMILFTIVDNNTVAEKLHSLE